MEKAPRESESDLLSPLRTQRGRGEEEEEEEEENVPVRDVDEQLAKFVLERQQKDEQEAKNMKNTRLVTATYRVHNEFIVPDYLLEDEENEKAVIGDVGSWYIKWDTLSYTNKEGEEIEVEPIVGVEHSHEFKWPDETRIGANHYIN